LCGARATREKAERACAAEDANRAAAAVKVYINVIIVTEATTMTVFFYFFFFFVFSLAKTRSPPPPTRANQITTYSALRYGDLSFCCFAIV
jgi:hypothetical protein